MDNLFIERLWRSLKYESVYLAEPEDGFQAERMIGEWLEFYNRRRPHSALGGERRKKRYGPLKVEGKVGKRHTGPRLRSGSARPPPEPQLLLYCPPTADSHN